MTAQVRYRDRIDRLAAAAEQAGLAGVIVGTGPELAYLTGSWLSSHERLTALTLSADGSARLVVPATDAGSLGDVGDRIEVIGWRDGEDPYVVATGGLENGTVGLGSSLTADHVLALQARLGATVLAAHVLSDVFAVKDSDELAQIERAAAAIDRVHEHVPALLQPGRTEEEVARELERLICAEHMSVDFVIVGSGENGANPHHSFSGRTLRVGEPVVVDIGGSLGDGYHSDCTRTYLVGTGGSEGDRESAADGEFQHAYAVLQRAHAAAVAAARPGMTAGHLDAVARDIIVDAGYGDFFTHRTGHGLGLSLHEPPFIIAGSDTVLLEGMVFSIEPGIYLPGRWGMRIEDIVVLEASGARSLNRVRRDLH